MCSIFEIDSFEDDGYVASQVVATRALHFSCTAIQYLSPVFFEWGPVIIRYNSGEFP